MRQQSVIVSLASSETVSYQREGHARNHSEVDAGIVGEEGTCGFLNAVRRAGGERAFSFINMEGQIHAYDGRQEDGLALCIEGTDEVVSIDFIG